MSEYHIINDETPESRLDFPGKGKGLDLSLRPRGANVYGDAADPFPDELLIPKSDWQGMIEEQVEQKSRLTDICDRAKVPFKDQKRTNYCWFNAPTRGLMVIRALQNQPSVDLSPASGAAQIKGYRNVGGWGREALAWILKNGIVPSQYWPDNAIDPRFATAANKALALKYRGGKHYELKPRNLEQVVSCLLRRLPVASGLNWWQHEVLYSAAMWIDNTIAIAFDNSWGTEYGNGGRGVLQGDRMLPDDAVVFTTALAA